ncbi:MAG: hypothetical protein MHM6MM_001832 [Cercozoa sp. M6MM]
MQNVDLSEMTDARSRLRPVRLEKRLELPRVQEYGSNEKQVPPLISAAMRGDLEDTRSLLLVEDPCQLDIHDKTAAHWAAYFDETEVLACLLQACPKLALCRSSKLQTPLHEASVAGAVDSVKLLLAQGSSEAMLNARNQWQETPLHLCASTGDAACVGVLLQAGADTEACDQWQRTPRQCALDHGEHRRVLHLFDGTDTESDETTASVTEVSAVVQSSFASPMVRQKLRPLAKLFEFPGDETVFAHLLQQPDVDPTGKDFYGNTALYKVCCWDRVPLLKLLVSHLRALGEETLRAALHAGCTIDKRTVLHACAEMLALRSLRYLQKECAALLPFCELDVNGLTPVDLAVQSGAPEELKSLLTYRSKTDEETTQLNSSYVPTR